ncbi:hypothetical protein RDWZM_000711 [Blomia tropicalis]|uniref:Uncharacterized protein n=1 Tax=Blomia tropicalis TaxID=40697 RepID=A0A9Q0MA90_BLOTA|nr:hypothetical protein RDWZM_000711 [Blomia tropicalis]
MYKTIVILLSLALLINAKDRTDVTFEGFAEYQFSCNTSVPAFKFDSLYIPHALARGFNYLLEDLETTYGQMKDDHEKMKDLWNTDLNIIVPAIKIPSNLTLEEGINLINEQTSMLLVELTKAMISPVFDEIMNKYNLTFDHLPELLQRWLERLHGILRTHNIKFKCEEYVHQLINDEPLAKVYNPDFYAAFLMHKFFKLYDFSSTLLYKSVILCRTADVDVYLQEMTAIHRI